MVGPAKDAIDRLGADCKDGGSFYVCQDKPTRFIGCCDGLDPCKTTDGNCPSANLRNTTFNKDKYDDIKAQDCVSSNATVQWYTCSGLDVPWMGCCGGGWNPCAKNGCPADNLFAAELSSNEENAASFLGTDDSDKGLSTGATAGIAVGVTIVGIALLAGAFWFWKRRKNSKTIQQDVSQERYGHRMSPSTATTAVYSPGYGSPREPKPLASPMAGSFAGDQGYDPLQVNAPTPSPQMSQEPWRHSANTNVGTYNLQHGYAPSSVSSAYGDQGGHGYHQYAGQQPAYAPVVSELPAQPPVVELPVNDEIPGYTDAKNRSI